MRYGVLSFLCIITGIAYVQRSAFNGATKTIERDLNLDPEDMGFVMGAWYLAYAVGQLPGGWIADRLGSKRALLIFATSWSVLTGLVGLSLGLLGLLLIWGFMGGAQAGIFPSCTKAIGATFPRTEQAIASGMLACCMSLGAALAPAITAQLLGPLSWQFIFALYAIPGLVWAVAFALFVPSLEAPTVPPQPLQKDDNADWHALPPTQGESFAIVEAADSPMKWSKLVTDYQMLLLCFQQFLRAGAMVLFFTWFARVLMEARKLSESESSRFSSWPPFVGMFGGLLGGFLSDWLLKRTENPRLARQGMTFVLMMLGTVVSLAAFFVDDPITTVSLMSVAAFCGMSGGVSGYSLAISYGGKRVATVFGTMNMSGNLGASLFPIAVGWIVAATGNWNYVLLLFAGMFAGGAVCWGILNPKGTLFEESHCLQNPRSRDDSTR